MEEIVQSIATASICYSWFISGRTRLLSELTQTYQGR